MAAKKTAKKKAPAPARKAPAKKAPAAKARAKAAPAKRASAARTPARKAPAKKAPVKRAAPKAKTPIPTGVVNQINLLSLHVTDFDRAVSFYRDALGLTGTIHGEFGWAEFKLQNDLTLGIHRDDCAPVGRRPGGTTGFFLPVKNIRAVVAELQKRGVSFTEQIEKKPYGVTAFFEDPDGNEFGLIESTS